MENFKLIVHAKVSPKLITLFRKYTGKPIAEIKTSLEQGVPIIDENIHHNTFDNFIEKMTSLFDELARASCSFTCIVDGEEEPLEYVRNVFDSWNQD
jgi:hypothetical protein